MAINRRDRDVDFYESFQEKQNPSLRKEKKASNIVLLFSVFIVVVAIAAWQFVVMQANEVEGKIQEQNDYMENTANVELYQNQLDLMARIKKIEDYNTASDTFLKQLENSQRLSTAWVEFFQTEMLNSVGPDARISSFIVVGETIELTCEFVDSDSPSIYAKHLDNIKGQSTNPQYVRIDFGSYQKEDEVYTSVIKVILRELSDEQKQGG